MDRYSYPGADPDRAPPPAAVTQAPVPAPLPWDIPLPHAGSDAASDSGTDPGADPADAAHDSAAPRERHDAFTVARKAKFLRALMKCGCITEACRRADVAPRTVYNHQQNDAEFLSHCATAQRMAAIPVEIEAWSRAVDGIEETVVASGRAVTRTRYSEPLLRMMLQASDPKRFGPNPGFTRKRLRAAERKEIEREVRREMMPQLLAEAEQKMIDMLDAVWREREEARRTAAGDGPFKPSLSPDERVAAYLAAEAAVPGSGAALRYGLEHGADSDPGPDSARDDGPASGTGPVASDGCPPGADGDPGNLSDPAASAASRVNLEDRPHPEADTSPDASPAPEAGDAPEAVTASDGNPDPDPDPGPGPDAITIPKSGPIPGPGAGPGLVRDTGSGPPTAAAPPTDPNRSPYPAEATAAADRAFDAGQDPP